MNQNGKSNIGSKIFWILMILTGIAELLMAILLEDHWLGLAAVAAVLVALIVLRIRGTKSTMRIVIALALAAVGAVVMALARPDKSVSFWGNLENNARLFNTVVIQHQSPEELAVSTHYEPYEFGSWNPPAGYTNEEVNLSHCKAYWLRKENGSHDKVVYQIHGGGYILGFNNYYNINAVMLSQCWDDADVFSIDYRSAEQEPYPAAIDDAVEGYQWLLDQGYLPEKIAVEGDSAGGGLSLGMTLRLRDEGAALPSCLILSSPWADVSQEGESYTFNRKRDAFFGCLDDDAVGKRALSTMYADGDSVYNPYISPVYADYEGMPPMLIQVATPEMLLSDSLTVAERAGAAGVPVQLVQYNGLWHVFFIADAEFREQKEAWDTIRTYLHTDP